MCTWLRNFKIFSKAQLFTLKMPNKFLYGGCRNIKLSKLQFLRFTNVRRCTVTTKTNTELPSAFSQVDLDGFLYDENYFKPTTVKSGQHFTLILPPPNITGTLHLGHALTATVQDVLVRWHKLRGFNSLWVPGIDHAGIATQVVVEKKLWKEKHVTRHELGRDLFEKEIWKWKEEKGNFIDEQFRRLMVSLDWQKMMFTMDSAQTHAVTEAFIRLYESGLVYRSDYLVNWSCNLQSAISDIEVEHLTVSGPTQISVPGYKNPVKFGTLFKFAYKLCDSGDELVVATTRPETIFGDTAVAVNPKDHRYTSFIGRFVWHPFRKEQIPIVADDFVDPEFGTGVVKLTPAHDPTDFAVGKKLLLKHLQIIDEKGNLTEVCGEFSGIRRFEARDIVLAELTKLNLLRGSQDHQMIIPICSRSKDIVEFLVKPQWFIKCDEMAKQAIRVVRDGRLSIVPEELEKAWFNWLENIRDWCVSRQLWWGHRIPAYECYLSSQNNSKVWVVARNIEEAKRKAKEKLSCTNDADLVIKQDEDVLDTWFSSGLLPLSAFGWPEKTEDLRIHYPLSLMETGQDILFFWVARMVMLGKQLSGQLPFPKVVLHGILCDAHGRKMSKSLGNVVAPEDIIEGRTLQKMEENISVNHKAGLLSDAELKKALVGQKKMFPQGIPVCGVDALRFTLCSHNLKHNLINFDVRECHTNRLFCNKLWQATKFTKIWTKQVDEAGNLVDIDVNSLPIMNKWILSRLSGMVDSVNDGIRSYDFHVACKALKEFLYYDFCDVFLETTKRGLRSHDSLEAAAHCWTLIFCLDASFRALSVFMPKLSQYLHYHLPKHPHLSQQYDFPEEIQFVNTELEKDVSVILQIILVLRKLKHSLGVTKKHQTKVHIIPMDMKFEDFLPVINDLAVVHSVISSNDTEFRSNNIISETVDNVKLYLEIPDDVKQRLETELPVINKKVVKIESEIERLKSRMSCESYHTKSVTTKELDVAKLQDLQKKLGTLCYVQKACGSFNPK